MKKYFRANYHIIIFIVIACAPFVWFSNGQILMGPDSLWNFNYNLDSIKHVLSGFNFSDGFGYHVATYNSILFYSVMTVLVSILGFSVGFVQKIILGMLIFLSIFFMYRLLRQITNNQIPKYLATITAVFYGINPFALTWIWWRFLWVMFIYVLLPIFFLVIDKIWKKEMHSKQYAILIISLPFIALGVGPLVILLLTAIIVVIYLVVFLYLQSKDISKDIGYFVKKMAIIIFLGISLSLWWFLPGVYSITNSLEHAKTAYDKTAALEYTSQYSTMLNNFGLLGYAPMYTSFIDEKYYGDAVVRLVDSGAFRVLSFIPLIIITIGSFVIFRKKTRVNKYAISFLVMFLLGLFLFKGIQEPLQNMAYKLMDIPIIGIAFRIPYDKFGYMVVFSLTVLLGLFLFILQKNKYYYRTLLILFLSMQIFLLGTFFSTSFLIQNKNKLSGIAVNIPQEYSDLAIADELFNSTILILPFANGHEYALNWESGIQPNGNNILSDYLRGSRFIFESNGNYYNDSLLKFMKENLFSGAYSIKYINTFLESIGVDYIFIHKDWKKEFMLQKTRDPEFYEKFFLNNEKVVLIKNNSFFDIYKIKNQRIKLFTATGSVNRSDNIFNFLSMGFSQVVIDEDSVMHLDNYNKVRINDDNKVLLGNNEDVNIFTSDNNPFVHDISTDMLNKDDWECYPKYKDNISIELENDESVLELRPNNNLDVGVCTMLPINNISNNGLLIIQFEYNSKIKRSAGFVILSSDENGKSQMVVGGKLPSTNGEWSNVNKKVIVQEGVKYRLFVYADGGGKVTKYKNFKFGLLPLNYKSLLYNQEIANYTDQVDKRYNVEIISRNSFNNKVNIKIKDVQSEYVFIKFNTSYDKGWRVKKKSGEIRHIIIDGYANGWELDVDKYCKEENLCTKNEDGSYDIEMVIEFIPQRWFYLGLLISGTTFVSLIGYLLYDVIRRRRNRVERL